MARSGGVVLGLSLLMATMWGCGIDDKPCLVLRPDGSCAERWPVHPPDESETAAAPKPLAEPKMSMHDIARRKARVARGQGATLGDYVYFAGDDGTHGVELMRTDGERVELVKDISVGSADSDIESVTSANGLVYFVVSDKNGRTIWRTDGTEAGTRFLFDLGFRSTMSTTSAFAVGGSRVFFVDHKSFSPTIMTTDGTKVEVFYQPKNVSFVRSLVTIGDVLYVVAGDGIITQVIKVDGATPTVLRTYRDMRGSSAGMFSDQQIVAAGNAIYFMAMVETGNELWKSDGTVAGTTLVAPGPATSLRPAYETDLVSLEGQVFYFANPTGLSAELFVTDGTIEGTKSLRKTTYASRIVATKKAVYITVPEGEEGAGGSGLVMTNGAVTQKMASRVRSVLGTSGDKIFFSADDDRVGVEPWMSDGTIEGTGPLGDLRQGPLSSEPTGLGAAKAGYVLAASDDVGDAQLWATDGTLGGAKPVARVNTNTIGSAPTGIAVLPSGAALFFASDGDTGTRVWFSDGTEKGTRAITSSSSASPFPPSSKGAFYSMSSNVAVLGNEAWFVAQRDGETRLFRTNGSTKGTTSVPLLTATSSARVTAVNESIYVTDEMSRVHYFDGTMARPLAVEASGGVLVHDGQRALTTSAGTGNVIAIVDGEIKTVVGGSMDVTGALPLGTKTIFTTIRRDLSSAGQAYVTEGDRETTFELLRAQSTVSFPSSGVVGVVGSSAIVEVSGSLYATDGTRDGTSAFLSNVRLHEAHGVALKGAAYFSATIDSKVGVYRTNGTKEGTVPVALFDEVQGEGPPLGLVVFRGRVWFTAYARDGGRELYSTDGAEGGTRRERDIAAGARSSNPSFLTVNNDVMWFAADDYKNGRELYRLK